MYDYYDDYSYYGDGISLMDIMDLLSGISDGVKFFLFLMRIAMLAAGIIQCFWGYKLYRFTIAVNGFITGSTVGLITGVGLVSMSDADSLSDVITFILIWMLICGIIGAVIAYVVETLGIFLVGFSGVYIVSLIISLLGTRGQNIALSLFLAAIPAVVAGILVVKFWKPIVIIYTGIYGAVLIAGGIGFGIIAIILCSVGGIFYQIKSNNGLTEYSENNRYVPGPTPNPTPNPTPQPVPYVPPQPIVNKEGKSLPDIID